MPRLLAVGNLRHGKRDPMPTPPGTLTAPACMRTHHKGVDHWKEKCAGERATVRKNGHRDMHAPGNRAPPSDVQSAEARKGRDSNPG